MEILYPVTAIHRDGETRVLRNLNEIAEFVRGRRVGPEWVTFRDEMAAILARLGGHGGRECDWILRDDRGRPVNHEHLSLPPLPRMGKWDIRFRARDAEKRRAMELGLPIPGTGKSRRGRHSCRCEYCLSSIKGRVLDRLADFEENASENDFDIWGAR